VTRARRAAWLGAFGGLVLLGVGIWLLVDGGRHVTATADLSRRAAAPPFGRFTETKVLVGGRALRVVVADDEAERVQGLRGRADLDGYDGMLFVFPSPTRTPFTMAGVPVPLDVGFYDGRGGAVGQLRMAPCQGTDAACPVYDIDRVFSFAVETPAGALPAGDLTLP
jgi:uncharacterized membrane protein (UPF0127 family)